MLNENDRDCSSSSRHRLTEGVDVDPFSRLAAPCAGVDEQIAAAGDLANVLSELTGSEIVTQFPELLSKLEHLTASSISMELRGVLGRVLRELGEAEIEGEEDRVRVLSLANALSVRNYFRRGGPDLFDPPMMLALAGYASCRGANLSDLAMFVATEDPLRSVQIWVLHQVPRVVLWEKCELSESERASLVNAGRRCAAVALRDELSSAARARLKLDRSLDALLSGTLHDEEHRFLVAGLSTGIVLADEGIKELVELVVARGYRGTVGAVCANIAGTLARNSGSRSEWGHFTQSLLGTLRDWAAL